MDLVKKLCQSDFKLRASAEEALEDPWLVANAKYAIKKEEI